MALGVNLPSLSSLWIIYDKEQKFYAVISLYELFWDKKYEKTKSNMLIRDCDIITIQFLDQILAKSGW